MTGRGSVGQVFLARDHPACAWRNQRETNVGVVRLSINEEGGWFMAKNTGEGRRDGAVDDRSQVKNPKTGQYVKRNRDPDSAGNGQFMDVKQDGTKFEGVAEEPDGRRKGGS